MKRIVIAIFLAAASYASAQTFRGSVQGAVVDSTGAAIADAQVTARNAATGLVRSVRTDATGNYFIAELPVGSYSVSATKSGFKTQTVTDVQVEVSAHERVDITLTPGEVKEEVVVTGEVPLVETTSDTMGGTIEGEQAAELPINGRDFTKLLVLVPGATGDPSGSTDSPGSFGLFSVNGSRGRSNNYLLDGTDMNDGYRNLPAINEAGVFGTPATLLPVDALQEVPVISGAEAEFGRNSGAIVNLVTKSGSNVVHGSAFEFFRNNALDARNFFNAKPLPQNGFHNNQFGGSLGGPLVKDTTFWFLSYEGQRERVGLPSLAHVPDPVSDIAANGGPTNPIIARLLAMHPWPAPNMAPDAAGNNLQATTRASNRVDSMIAKIDHHLLKNDVFTGRYFFGDSDQSFPLALLGGNVLPGYNTVTPTRVQVLSLSLTHTFTPKLLMELRGGWNRFAEQFFPEDHNFDPNSIGLATTTNGRDFGLPLISVSGFAPIGANVGNPRGRVDTNWQLFDNVSYSTGKHNWKAGYEFRRTFINGFFDAGYRGKLSFASIQDFLSGTVDSGRQAMGDSNRGTFQNNHSFYLQDNIQLSRRVTANVGLRWDYFGVIGEAKDRFSLFSPTNGLELVGHSSVVCPAVVGVSCPAVGPSSLYPKDYNNFAPRLSVAWDLAGNGKTVLRGGWGVFYDAFSQDFFVGQLPFNTFNPGPAYNGVGISPVLFSFSPTSTLVPGSPVFSDFAATDVFTVDQKLRTPYVQNFNLNLERDLRGRASVQIAYVGSVGHKLFHFRDINQQTDPSGTRPFDALLAPAPSPPDTKFVYINQFESTANSNYHGLQLSLKLRNLRGITSEVNYTWSHSIDTASDGQDYVPNAAQPDNSFNPRAERANSNFDTRQRFTWYWTWELPKFGSSPTLSNGWAINGVVTLMTGMPFNVNYLFENDFNGSGEFFGRPDLVGNPFAGTHTPDSYLNLAAFAVPCTYDPVSGGCSGGQHFGSLGRNAFRGPGYHNFDLSLTKNTALGEKVKMQFRLDAFNVLNHPNFSNPLLPNFGVDFAQNLDNNGRGVGFLGIGATPDVGIGNPFLGGGGPRNLQVALRFSF